MNENQALQLRENARNELMQIKDIETGFEYLNKVKAIEVWAKAEKKDAELQNLIAEQKIRTQRILGKLIKEGQEAGEIASQSIHPGSIPQGHTAPRTLSEIGLTAKESSTFQKIADIPDEIFENTITEKKEAVTKAVSELTTAGMLKVAKEAEYEKKKAQASLSDRDMDLISRLNNGETIVVNQRTDLATIKWAEQRGKYVRCDRFSDWGNPYEMGKDGDRDEVCDNYRDHYINFKPSLIKKIHTLKGKALGCWCAPERCHCETLRELTEEN